MCCRRQGGRQERDWPSNTDFVQQGPMLCQWAARLCIQVRRSSFSFLCLTKDCPPQRSDKSYFDASSSTTSCLSVSVLCWLVLYLPSCHGGDRGIGRILPNGQYMLGAYGSAMTVISLGSFYAALYYSLKDHQEEYCCFLIFTSSSPSTNSVVCC